MQVKTIQEVLLKLEEIIAWARENESPVGYFAALYYRMTLAVSEAVQNGEFENGSRMEQMDVIFARRYFDALEAWRSGQPPTLSWKIAFEATQDKSVTVLQHLLLGMNAHINLDLGIAAASVRQKDAIFGMRKDFMHINEIIERLTDKTQSQLAGIGLPFSWLDRALRTEDEGWIGFSIKTARGASWKSAQLLAFAPDKNAETGIIQQLDQTVSFLGKRLITPGFWLRLMLRWMRYSEKGSVRDKIDLLFRG
ncbi:MAG: hypothetical protein IT261_04370 [Saprospiraceae bacterium]|nr:hypothetical protein [Saprospiraceae bacterium]